MHDGNESRDNHGVSVRKRRKGIYILPNLVIQPILSLDLNKCSMLFYRFTQLYSELEVY